MHLIGYALIIFSATTLGLSPSLTKLTFAQGVGLPLAMLSRFVVGALLVGMLIGHRTQLRALLRPLALTLMVCYSAIALLYISSYLFIPVSASVVFFFTFPFMVALLDSWRHKTRLPWFTWCCLAAAFTGIALIVLGAPTAMNPIGIALALGAALSNAVLMVFLRPVIRETGILPFVGLSSLLGLPFFALWAGWGDPFADITPLGWQLLCLVAVLFVLGITSYYKAIAYLGPVRVALLSNLEPVVGLMGGVFLVSEIMGQRQLLGGGLVITALLANVWLESRRKIS